MPSNVNHPRVNLMRYGLRTTALEHGFSNLAAYATPLGNFKNAEAQSIAQTNEIENYWKRGPSMSICRSP